MQKKKKKIETQGLAVPIINHYMLMSFHTQRSVSVCVFACLNVYSRRRVHNCVGVCANICMYFWVWVCVCVSQRIEGTALLLCSRDRTRPSPKLFMVILPARWKALPLHFLYIFPINIKHYYNEMGFSYSLSLFLACTHTHTLCLSLTHTQLFLFCLSSPLSRSLQFSIFVARLVV